MAWLTPPDCGLARFVMAAAIGALLMRYLAWRISETWPFDASLDWESGWRWCFAFVETLGLTGVGFSWLFHSRCINRSREAARLAATFESRPPVDVFIPTYNESAEILERTVACALAMDYPHFRVWLLDDGGRDFVRALADRFGVGYLARQTRAHAKAGNMNAGLSHVLALADPPEFIAILDADFVPGRAFLSRTLPLFAARDVGLVQTPQHFFNPDPMQTNLDVERLVPDDQRFTQGVDLPSRDAWGVATSCGTSSVLRVSSLIAIGGFPTESICEDTLTSIKFWTLGQKTVFLDEPLTQGLAVEGVAELLTQRSRWATGNMQILRSEWGVFSRHKIPFLGRLFLASLFFGAVVSPINRIVIVVSPAIFLFTGVLPIEADFQTLAGYLGPFLLAHYIGTAWISHGANIPVLNDALLSLEYCSTFGASLSALLFPKGRPFEVTEKGVSRVRAVVHWRLVLLFAAPILTYVVALVYDLAIGNMASPDPLAYAAAIVWCVYNSLFLALGVLLSIDLPRSAQLDVFEVNEPATLRVDGQETPCRALALSSVSATALLPRNGDLARLDAGATTELILSDGCALQGRIETGAAGGRFSFTLDETSRPLAARYLFRGCHVKSVRRMSVARGLLRIGRRLVA